MLNDSEGFNNKHKLLSSSSTVFVSKLHVTPFQSFIPLCALGKFSYPGFSFLLFSFVFDSKLSCMLAFLPRPPITPQSIRWKIRCVATKTKRVSRCGRAQGPEDRKSVLEDSAAVQVDIATVEASEIKTECEKPFGLCLP